MGAGRVAVATGAADEVSPGARWRAFETSRSSACLSHAGVIDRRAWRQITHMLPHAVIALVLLISGAAHAASEKYEGVVTRVIDGDTLILRYVEHHVSVQLEGVDAPEPGEPYARRAAESLARLCHRQPAIVHAEGADAYGRVLGEVICNGVNVNQEQLRRGMGRLETPADAPPAWRKLQRDARSAGRGLWAGEAQAH